MRGQVAARAIGVVMGLQGSVNPLAGSATFRSFDGLPFPELVRRLAEPSVRVAITGELTGDGGRMVGMLDGVYELSDPPDYEPAPSDSIAARAGRIGVAPVEMLYDLVLGDDGHALLYWPVLNYADGNLDAAGELLAHQYTVPGLSDGGAHVGTICDASFPTTLLAHWGRDRTRGPKFEVEWLVQQQCRATAEAVGLRLPSDDSAGHQGVPWEAGAVSTGAGGGGSTGRGCGSCFGGGRMRPFGGGRAAP